jgi:predicted secreted Zn-dependent protease
MKKTRVILAPRFEGLSAANTYLEESLGMRKILPLLALLVSLPVAAEPLIRQHTSFYYIDGASATLLAAQLDQTGPLGADGKRYAAKTRWDVTWRFGHTQKGSTCSITRADVVVGIAQAMPKWRGEDKGAPALKDAWTKFAEALQRHEDGHKENGMKAAKEIESAVLATKPGSNCEDVEAKANAAAVAIVEKYQALDEEFDRKTDHGRNQGASLL